MTSLEWLKREQASLFQLYAEEEFIAPVLENFPALAQMDLDEIASSMANLRLVIPDYSFTEKVGDPSLTQLAPDENLKRIAKNALTDLLANLRIQQADTIEVEFNCFTEDETFTAEELPDEVDPLNQIGFLSEQQLERTVELVLQLARAVFAGMPLPELQEKLMTAGTLSFGTALSLMNLVTITHTQLLLENERADLAELMSFTANEKALATIESTLQEAAKNFPHLKSVREFPQLLQGTSFYHRTFSRTSFF